MFTIYVDQNFPSSWHALRLARPPPNVNVDIMKITPIKYTQVHRIMLFPSWKRFDNLSKLTSHHSFLSTLTLDELSTLLRWHFVDIRWTPYPPHLVNVNFEHPSMGMGIRNMFQLFPYYKWEDPPLPLQHRLYLGLFYSTLSRSSNPSAGPLYVRIQNCS